MAIAVLGGAMLLGAGWVEGDGVAVTEIGAVYTQSFDTLASSGRDIPWSNGSTVAGWYAAHNGTVLIPEYRAGRGTDTAGALYSFGSSGSAERALGSIASNSFGDVLYGVRLVNSTGETITSLQLSYMGEQWRDSGVDAGHRLDVQYLIVDAGELAGVGYGAGWATVAPLSFSSPSTSGGSPVALDGNLAANRSEIAGTIAFSAAPGQEIWLRWRDANDSYSDHALAIDDVRIVAGTGAATWRPIHDIQGAGTRSPVEGSTVTTRGVVTAVRHNGFFLQAPEGEYDADDRTSEGIFIYTGGDPPPGAAIGNLVEVVGWVSEYVPATDPGSPPLTELAGSPSVTVLVTGQDVPAPIVLAASDASPDGELDQLERFEGMRVAVDCLTVVGPTQGTVDETTATAASNGVFFGVMSGTPRPFREPGIAAPDPLPLSDIPRFDANPERLRVDSDGLLGSTALEVTAGATVGSLVGPLDYAHRTYTILPEPGSGGVVEGLAATEPASLPAANQVTVATWNLQRFFNDRNDPTGAEGAVLTPAAFANRLRKASAAVRELLHCPDILAVQEVENLATLEALASRIDADAAAAGSSPPGYRGHLLEGNDPSGMDVGFLVRDGRALVIAVEQVGKGEILTWDGTLLHDRPPLILEASVEPTLGSPFTLIVIVNHLRSLIDIDDPSTGDRVRAKRAQQAEFLARLVDARLKARPDERILLLGDLNAFQFNDGYVDVLGTVAGDPTPAGQVLVASPDLLDPDLVNLLSRAPAAGAYEYVRDGNAQCLSHVLVTQSLLPLVTRLEFVHLAADFPESYRNDPARPERLSDHDAVVVYLGSPGSALARPPRRRLTSL